MSVASLPVSTRPAPAVALAPALGLALALATGSAAAAQDIGFEGPSYAGSISTPSGSKPESKLWFHDDAWWGSLYSATSQTFSIHRLDLLTQTWSDTGVPIDPRNNSRADCLADGARLYVGSHRFNPAGGNAGHPLVVFRYTYDPLAGSYAADPGFPVQIADSSSETLVVAKDSTGVVWAAWMRDLRVHLAYASGDERSWTEFVLPWSTTDVSTDDVCSLVHFGGDRLGILWSDQVSGSYFFSAHEDGAPETVWSTPEPVLTGLVDDHVNLMAAADGRVFAVLKTSTDEIRLGVRKPDGSWADHLVATAADGWTRPIGVLDEDAGEVHVFATSPILLGTIYTKKSAMDSIEFPPGIGDVAIRKLADPSHNDSTSTKQSLGGSTGLVVLASHQPDERYWHHHAALGGPLPSAPVARFDAAVRTGFADLEVRFHDLSEGGPTSWSWDFGDGATSSEQHPVHVYSAPGTYTVELEVSNALGQDTRVRTDLIDVDPAPTALTLLALEDASVRQVSPGQNYGTEEFLRVRRSSESDYRTFVTFLVPHSANDVVSATLRLFVTDPSPDGGTVRAVDTGWSEPFVTWASAPTLTGAVLGSLGNVSTGTWVQLDVTSALTGSGLVSFGIESFSSNSVFYSSRQGQNPPELVLVLEPPVVVLDADFTCDRTAGRAPLRVRFTDTSTGSPTAWSWDFGDGATSTEQNPEHVYTQPGEYTVGLTVSDGTGMDTLVVPDHVRVRPPTIRPSGPPAGMAQQASGIRAGAGGTGSAGRPSVALPRWQRSPGVHGFAAVIDGDIELASELVELALHEAGWDVESTRIDRAGSAVERVVHVGARSERTLSIELVPRPDGRVSARLALR